jgi:hypothetical protein
MEKPGSKLCGQIGLIA